MTLPEPGRSPDKLSILKRIALFASCTEDQLHLIAERSRLVEYKKGEAVYRENDSAEAFYIVASGRLQVFTMSGEQRQVLTVLHNGDTFGEISLLTGETHSATVEAINDSLVIRLDKAEFEGLINRVPSLVLHLSRLLSKRLRSKTQSGGEGEATIVAIYSAAPGVGKTLFSVALATALRRETHRDVVVVDFKSSDTPSPRFGFPKPSVVTVERLGSLWSEELLEREIVKHPFAFHVLSAGGLLAGEEGEFLVALLVNGLAKRYSYILLDLPVQTDATVLKALTQADLVYLVTDANKQNVVRTSALGRQLREAVRHRDDHVKMILNLMEGVEDRLVPSAVAETLGMPPHFTLPYIEAAPEHLDLDALSDLLGNPTSTYAMTVRRIARELGGLLIGLALGSGAALGLAHIGILKVLEREKIPVDLIAGSSIGALLGALWAAGKSADDLEALAMKFRNPWAVQAILFLDFGIPLFSILLGACAGWLVGALAGVWTGILFGLIVGVSFGLVLGPLAGGPIQGARIMDLLQVLLGDQTFDDTRIPLRVIAANPMAREEIVFQSGRIADAVRASISIPGIFKPVKLLGKLCLDGGVVNPVPVTALKKAGARRVIAVNVFPTTPEIIAYEQTRTQQRAARDAEFSSKPLIVRLFQLMRREIRRSVSPMIFDVIMRSMQSMEYQIAEIGCHEADLTLRPTLAGSSWLEFYHPEKFIRRGEEEAMRMLPMLKRMAGLEPSPAKPPADLPAEPTRPIVRTPSLTSPSTPDTIHL